MILVLLRINLIFLMSLFLSDISVADELVHKNSRSNFPVGSCILSGKEYLIVACDKTTCSRGYPASDYTCIVDKSSCSKNLVNTLLKSNEYQLSKKTANTVELTAKDSPDKKVFLSLEKITIKSHNSHNTDFEFDYATARVAAGNNNGSIKETENGLYPILSDLEGCPPIKESQGVSPGIGKNATQHRLKSK